QNYVPSTFAHSIVQTWTLDVEMIFYILLPVAAGLAMWSVRGRGTTTSRFWLVIAGCAVVAAASIKMRMGLSEFAFDKQQRFPTYAFAFTPGIALGALAAVIPSWLAARPELGRRLSWAAWGLIWV